MKTQAAPVFNARLLWLKHLLTAGRGTITAVTQNITAVQVKVLCDKAVQLLQSLVYWSTAFLWL